MALTLNNGRKFVAHPDCVVSSALIYSAIPEYHEIRFIRRRLDRDDVVVDVGANVGHVGLLLSDAVDPKNIFAFEPTKITFNRLKENWKLNNFPLDGLVEAAVGDQVGVVSFPDSADPNTMNSISAAQTASKTREIKIVTLDSCRTMWQSRKVGFLKIDVEGHEPAVFAGAKEMLRGDRPKLIMFESLDGKVESSIRRILDDANYTIFQLNSNGEPDLGRTDAQNLFAAPFEILTEITNI